MEVRKVTGKEAEGLTINFEITREMFEASLPQLDAILKAHGWVDPQEKGSSSKASKYEKYSK